MLPFLSRPKHCFFQSTKNLPSRRQELKAFRRIYGYAPNSSLRISFSTPSIPGTVFVLSLLSALFGSSRVKSSSRVLDSIGRFFFFHASRSRGSSFERVNHCRAVRHFRRKTDNWSFHQYIESPVRPCPRRGIDWSPAATTFRLATRTVSSNDPTDPAEPSTSMSLDYSRCTRSLFLLSRFVL